MTSFKYWSGNNPQCTNCWFEVDNDFESHYWWYEPVEPNPLCECACAHVHAGPSQEQKGRAEEKKKKVLIIFYVHHFSFCINSWYSLFSFSFSFLMSLEKANALFHRFVAQVFYYCPSWSGVLIYIYNIRPLN